MARKKKKFEEITPDMTPMIDVTFLLLIFFIVTLKFKVLEGRLDAALPKDRGSSTSQAEEIEKIDIQLYVADPGDLDKVYNEKTGKDTGLQMYVAELGWANHAVVANRILHKRSGVQRGFATYAVRAKEQEPNGPALLLENTAQDIQAGKRALIWAHYMAPHQPYEPNPAHLGKYSTAGGMAASKANLEAIHADSSLASATTLEHLRSLYDEEILTANDYVVTFLTGLEAQYQAAGRGAGAEPGRKKVPCSLLEALCLQPVCP